MVKTANSVISLEKNRNITSDIPLPLLPTADKISLSNWSLKLKKIYYYSVNKFIIFQITFSHVEIFYLFHVHPVYCKLLPRLN